MAGHAPFVVIAGNIGVGKSTLVARLARQWHWQAAHEPNDENPYLADFYADMPRWAFQSQTFFLSQRLKQHNRICNANQPTLQDRSVYEDAEIFARNLHNQGHLTGRDWDTYYGLYQTMAEIIRPPDLVVYLRASVETLQARVARRGRDYERAIPADYLNRLSDLYDDWAKHFTLAPLVVVGSNELNWADPASDLGLRAVSQVILARLPG
jgi:deoxyadenosine/deoxycytidine kinase